jgi:hypothetical protein
VLLVEGDAPAPDAVAAHPYSTELQVVEPERVRRYLRAVEGVDVQHVAEHGSPARAHVRIDDAVGRICTEQVSCCMHGAVRAGVALLPCVPDSHTPR